MKTEIKKMDLLAARWWNPLFWSVVVFAPLFGLLLGIVYGALIGGVGGYEKGLEEACRKLHHLLSKLP